MTSDTLERAVDLAQRIGHVFIATADEKGLPHVAAAGAINLDSEGVVLVTAWFCPGTIENIAKNRRISVVAWDSDSDTGYQLLGTVERVEDLSMLDGYSPAVERGKAVPQVERQLVVRVEKVLDFTHAPHTDQVP